MSDAIRRKEIRSLTGVRGIAACWVVAYHTWMTGNHRIPGPAGQIMLHGYLGVDLFFVLSGMVMSMSYGRLFDRPWSGSDYATLMIRRVARLWPLYVVTLLVTGVLSLLMEHKTFSAFEWFVNILMIQSWSIADSINSASWSVSVECAAYLVFPFLCAVILRRTWALSVITAAISIFIVWWLANVAGVSGAVRKGPLDIFDARTFLPVIRCVSGFTLGMVCYRLAISGQQFIRSQTVSILSGMLVLVLLSISGTDVLIVVAFALLLITLTNEETLISRFMAWTPVYYLGVWSYAIYLWHRSFLLFIGDVWSGHHVTVRPAAVLALLIVVSWLSYNYIEMPFQKKIRGIEKRLFPASDRKVVRSEAEGTSSV